LQEEKSVSSVNNSIKIDLNQDELDAQTPNLSDAEWDKMNAEIMTAIRSMKTNLLLSSTFLFIFFALAMFTDTFNVLICSFLKCLVPVLTTIANFGKIQHILLLYWQSFREQVSELLKKLTCKCSHQ
jgi:hypothetical protein